MGIPYYFYSLTKKYKNIIINKIPDNPDIYCIDFNGIIHPVAANIIKDTNNDLCDKDKYEDKIIKALWEKVIEYINIIKPKNLIICVDGVAPVAKMAQQRKRRYLTVYRNKIDNIQSKWDTNAITPGTDFMTKLNNHMKSKIRYNTTDVKINYSGSDEVGEGEHKIFAKISYEKNDDIIVIHGLDADLIILSLLSHKKNIYLMREAENSVYTYLNIQELRRAVIIELVKKWELSSKINDDIYSIDANNIIESYCVICSILGNDFIPHILSLNLKQNGLEKLINCCNIAIKNNGLLVSNNTINHKCLTDIFIEIAKNEDKDIFKECEEYIKKHIGPTELVSELYAIKNKDPLANIIYSNISKWKQNYYKHLFNININNDSSVLNSACESYIKGIYWTYAYYKRKDLDHYWYYPYCYAPSIKDIANYSQANNEPVIVSNGTFVNSSIQLLIVLPKDSVNLLQPNHRKYMEDVRSGLYHMYPKEYKIYTFLKTHLWECVPNLPFINIKNIIKVVNK